MDISIDNDEGLDFGTLVFQPDRDEISREALLRVAGKAAA